MIGSAVRWRYQNISSERQRPRIWMMLVSTLATNNAIAPAACRDLVDTSDVRNPKAAPRRSTVDLRVLVMRKGVTDWVCEPLPVYTRRKGVDKGAL